ncbi:MAG: hypothetical protein QN178_18100 [Armatimonadota bacterium]|nr:hypothetical protein [Armatimonadota bacterium]
MVPRADEPVVRQRLDGVLAAIRNSRAPIRAEIVEATRDPYEAAAKIDKWALDNKTRRGLFALDNAATDGVVRTMQKRSLWAKGVRAGAYGVLPAALELIDEGRLDFTVDEQPYLQGFVPVLQLFLFKLSGGLVAPADTDTGARLVTKASVRAYLAKTRFQGSSSRHRYPILP